MFSTSIIEKLAYYIYCLIDPRDGNIFYVGKGVGNRVFPSCPRFITRNRNAKVIKLP